RRSGSSVESGWLAGAAGAEPASLIGIRIIQGETGMATDNFTIGHVGRESEERVRIATENLDAAFEKVDEEGNMSPVDLMALQRTMSLYTLVVSIASSLIKELSDTMKSVCQKIS